MTAVDPREAKLPQWAKTLLSQERYAAQKAQDRLAEHLRTVEPTPIWYGDHQNRIYVPVDHGYQTVYFSTTGEPSERSYDEIGFSFRRGTIQVQAGRRLNILSNASNCIDLELRE